MTKKIFIFFFTLIVLTGCGSPFLPQPTKKSVSMSDITGVWQYEINHELWKGTPKNDGIIKIEFMADGTFRQNVVISKSSQSIFQIGHWQIEGANINLPDVLMEVAYQNETKWEPMSQTWWIIDGHQKGVCLSIFGGANPDPDQYQEFKRIANEVKN